MTIEQAIKHAEEVAQEKRYEYQECLAVHDMEEAMDCRKCGEEHEQLAAWLRELQERREEPEIVTCYECKHYLPVSQTSNSWGKCSVHSSTTKKQRTCQSCDYCSWAERRTE